MDNFFGSVRQTYNQIAANFSRTRVNMWPEVLPYIQQIAPNSSVLDLGCGNGRLINSLPNQINYLGIDFSDGLIKEARRIHTDSNFLRADITTIRLKENYDAICCLAVLHHLPLDQQLIVMKIIKEHLNPNGLAIITVWDLKQEKYGSFVKGDHALIPFEGIDRACYVHSLNSLKNLAKEAGFEHLKGEQTKGNLILQLS